MSYDDEWNERYDDVEDDDWPEGTKFSRGHLEVERLYHEQPTGMYFFTPDGIGCVWYETREEAMADTDAFGKPIITICQELSDF